MKNRAVVICAAAVWMAGCTSSSTPSVVPGGASEQSTGLKQATFYVAGMNERLKIL